MVSGEKKPVVCRLSMSEYEDVMNYVGEAPKPFRTVSDYMYSLITFDLAARKKGISGGQKVDELLMLLNDPAIRDCIKKIVDED